jgi:PQQ-dependent catabolism-associated CXXCW motif protein
MITPPRLACIALALALLTCAAQAGEPVAEPTDYRMSDFRAPVPASLAGARVVDTAAAHALMEAGAVMIDVYPRAPKPPNLPANTVWREPAHESIEGGHWLPNVGYGKLAAEPEAYFRRHLERLSGGDKAKPLVFFCLENCWMSWNAAKRALEWGYSNVVWYPEGTDGWRAAGHPIARAEPAP